MDNTILESLKNIDLQVAQLNKVAFVFQPWIEFNNLGPDGFRIPAVQHPTIPRLTLIPLVSINVRHIESRKSLATNKFVPMPVAYQRPIYDSYIDLLQKYGAYGLTLVEPLSCNLSEAVRTAEVFEMMMERFHNGGLLEDLPAYFGVESPVKDQLETTPARVTWTAEQQLVSLYKHTMITEAERDKMIKALPLLADSVTKAHRKALNPSDGVLPQSIQEINKDRKPKFDEVDTFIQRQFPGYNSDSLISHKSSNSDISRLTDVLEKLVADRISAPAPKGIVEEVARVVPDIADMLPENNADSDELTGAALDSDQGLSSESLEVELDPEKCQGISKSSGLQCKLAGNPEAEYPEYCLSHQDQGKVAAEFVDSISTDGDETPPQITQEAIEEAAVVTA